MAKETYKGVDAVAGGLGQSSFDGAAGTLGGAAAGAAAGALAHSKKMVAVAAEQEGLIAAFKGAGRGTKALVGAIVGGLAVGTITQITGWLRGSKKAEEGRAQFERLSAENEQLQAQLNSANAQLATQQKSFAEKISTERSAEKSPQR